MKRALCLLLALLTEIKIYAYKQYGELRSNYLMNVNGFCIVASYSGVKNSGTSVFDEFKFVKVKDIKADAEGNVILEEDPE